MADSAQKIQDNVEESSGFFSGMFNIAADYIIDGAKDIAADIAERAASPEFKLAIAAKGLEDTVLKEIANNETFGFVKGQEFFGIEVTEDFAMRTYTGIIPLNDDHSNLNEVVASQIAYLKKEAGISPANGEFTAEIGNELKAAILSDKGISGVAPSHQNPDGIPAVPAMWEKFAGDKTGTDGKPLSGDQLKAAAENNIDQMLEIVNEYQQEGKYDNALAKTIKPTPKFTAQEQLALNQSILPMLNNILSAFPPEVKNFINGFFEKEFGFSLDDFMTPGSTVVADNSAQLEQPSNDEQKEASENEQTQTAQNEAPEQASEQNSQDTEVTTHEETAQKHSLPEEELITAYNGAKDVLNQAKEIPVIGAFASILENKYFSADAPVLENQKNDNVAAVSEKNTAVETVSEVAVSQEPLRAMIQGIGSADIIHANLINDPKLNTELDEAFKYANDDQTIKGQPMILGPDLDDAQRAKLGLEGDNDFIFVTGTDHFIITPDTDPAHQSLTPENILAERGFGDDVNPIMLKGDYGDWRGYALTDQEIKETLNQIKTETVEVKSPLVLVGEDVRGLQDTLKQEFETAQAANVPIPAPTPTDRLKPNNDNSCADILSNLDEESEVGIETDENGNTVIYGEEGIVLCTTFKESATHTQTALAEFKAEGVSMTGDTGVFTPDVTRDLNADNDRNAQMSMTA